MILQSTFATLGSDNVNELLTGRFAIGRKRN